MSNSPETPVPSVSEQMPALAQEFAQACKANGVALDFLPRTLPLVDRLIKTVPASTSPKIGISSAPAQIKKNWRTSLKIAERNPPRAT